MGFDPQGARRSILGEPRIVDALQALLESWNPPIGVMSCLGQRYDAALFEEVGECAGHDGVLVVEDLQWRSLADH